MPLSVSSALSRLGLDPRGEAARLSDLAGEAAADQLAQTIARLPDRRWTSSEIRKIAGGLIELLPRATKRGKNDEATGSALRKVSSRASPFLICLALAGAVLIGFLAHGALSLRGAENSQPAPQTNPQPPPG